MIDAKISIGGRQFRIATEADQEELLVAAAKILDEQAQVLIAGGERLTENQLLLMSGLMMASKHQESFMASGDRQQVYHDLENELTLIRSKMRDAEISIHSLQEENQKLKTENQQPTEKLVELEAEREALQGRINTLEAEKESQSQERSEAIRQAQEAQASVDEKNTEINSANSQILALQEKTRNFENELEELRDIATQAAQSNADDDADLQSELVLTQEALEAAKAQLNEHANTIARLQNENAQANQDVKNAQSEIAQLKQAPPVTPQQMAEPTPAKTDDGSSDAMAKILSEVVGGLEKIAKT